MNAAYFRKKAYVPTPEQIARECAAISAGWSDEERSKRAVGRLNASLPRVIIRRLPPSARRLLRDS